MTIEQPRVLIVGIGGYGQLYLNMFLNGEAEGRLVGVCDTNPRVAERFPGLAARGIPVFSSLRAFFAERTADLAVLISPVQFHTEMALHCLANGCNVLCEKPLCLTRAEAGQMDDAAQKAGRFLSVGYQLNYRRDVLALKKDILAGRYGKPLRLSCCHGYRRGGAYYARNQWAGRIESGGRRVLDSPFNNACAHNFQMMTFLLGSTMDSACELTDAEGELYRGNPGVENYDIAALRFHTADGVPLLYCTAHPIQSECLGPKGSFEFENGVITFDSESPSFRAVLNSGEQIDYSQIDPGHPMQKLLDALDCTRDGGAPLCGVKADLAHISAVQMAQELPIHPVREELRAYAEERADRFCVIRGLEEVLLSCAEHARLPRELGYELD